MKKFLLMSCAALVAVTASAHKFASTTLKVDATNLKTMSLNNTDVKLKMSNLQGVAPASKTFTTAKSKVAKAAAASLSGLFVEDYILVEELHATDSVGIAPASAEDEDGNTYNTALSFYGWSLNPQPVYGQYDEAAGTLTVPCGQVCQTSDTYGEIGIYGYKDNQYTETLTFDVEDGILYLEEDGYQTLFSYNGTQYYWKDAYAATLLPQTGEITYSSKDQGEWNEYTSAVAVVEDDYSLTVYNAFDLGATGLNGTAVTVNKNDDGTYSMPAEQNIYYCPNIWGSNWTATYTETYGDYLYLHGAVTTVKTDEETGEQYYSAEIDETVTAFDGQDYNGSILFPCYFPTITEITEEGMGYGWWNFGIEITKSATGIDGVTVNKDNTLNGRIYNLNGQQVDKSYKGIVIKNGKKMLQK